MSTDPNGALGVVLLQGGLAIKTFAGFFFSEEDAKLTAEKHALEKLGETLRWASLSPGDIQYEIHAPKHGETPVKILRSPCGDGFLHIIVW